MRPERRSTTVAEVWLVQWRATHWAKKKKIFMREGAHQRACSLRIFIPKVVDARIREKTSHEKSQRGNCCCVKKDGEERGMILSVDVHAVHLSHRRTETSLRQTKEERTDCY